MQIPRTERGRVLHQKPLTALNVRARQVTAGRQFIDAGADHRGLPGRDLTGALHGSDHRQGRVKLLTVQADTRTEPVRGAYPRFRLASREVQDLRERARDPAGRGLLLQLLGPRRLHERMIHTRHPVALRLEPTHRCDEAVRAQRRKIRRITQRLQTIDRSSEVTDRGSHLCQHLLLNHHDHLQPSPRFERMYEYI